MSDEVGGGRLLEQYRSTGRILIGTALLAALAFLLVQGRHIEILNFFTPVQHDDLYALSGNPHFRFWLVRPVSSNFIYMVGALGPGVYYGSYFAVWMIALAMTQILACRLFDAKWSDFLFYAFAFVSCVTWFSLGSSVMSMQYLGLVTNALSYLFALSAALILIRPRISALQLAGALIFVLLSAFAKEDMLAFLGILLAWRLMYDRAQAMPMPRTLKRFFSLAVLILIAYVLSVLHSKAVGSPYTADTGSYDLSTPLNNLWKNSKGFYFSTPGTQIIILLSIAAAAGTLLRWALLRTWDAAADFVATLLPFGLALPYLLLPRYVEYYVVTFIPLAIAIFPAVLSRFVPKWKIATGVILSVVVAFVLFKLDTPWRAAQLDWNAAARTVSRHQIQELERLRNQGLAQCGTVAVTGTNAYPGPFLSGNSDFVNKILGAPIYWRIATEPNTTLGAFADVTKISDANWRYFKSESEAKATAKCEMSFDKDGYASFLKF